MGREKGKEKENGEIEPNSILGWQNYGKKNDCKKIEELDF